MDIDPVGQLVLGDLEEGFEQLWLDDLVRVGNQRVGKPEGLEMLYSGLALGEFAAPVSNNGGDTEFCGFGGCLPVPRLVVPRNAREEKKRKYSSCRNRIFVF